MCASRDLLRVHPSPYPPPQSLSPPSPFVAVPRNFSRKRRRRHNSMRAVDLPSLPYVGRIADDVYYNLRVKTQFSPSNDTARRLSAPVLLTVAINYTLLAACYARTHASVDYRSRGARSPESKLQQLSVSPGRGNGRARGEIPTAARNKNTCRPRSRARE